MTQARAVCHVGNREILTVNAALGHRPLDRRRAVRDDARRALAAGVRVADLPDADRRHDQRPARPAPGEGSSDRGPRRRPGDGQTVMWARIPDVIEAVDATTLAVLGDFVPMGVGQALGVRGGGNSLDNTLRVGQLVPDEVGAARHPGARGAAWVRARPRAHVRRGRHAARDRESELHRELLEGRPPDESGAESTRRGADRCRYRSDRG